MVNSQHARQETIVSSRSWAPSPPHQYEHKNWVIHTAHQDCCIVGYGFQFGLGAELDIEKLLYGSASYQHCVGLYAVFPHECRGHPQCLLGLKQNTDDATLQGMMVKSLSESGSEYSTKISMRV
ncbi:hypothetical protein CISG_03117 [Coccidioides immitis RMSCC 3703]|uniref:Uncharacterized protein n=2 Tax=Coccidioides immitis TaxID=5501 RepID=A0A0J8TGB7_COCIT|nr:hypothetical protein CIRG_04107 [Coccidioides immitis RMSCC 2394]KMU72682.1 hypothetical protein CISG_03117 [Coccidioides immitis RMSCC 3703]